MISPRCPAPRFCSSYQTLRPASLSDFTSLREKSLSACECEIKTRRAAGVVSVDADVMPDIVIRLPSPALSPQHGCALHVMQHIVRSQRHRWIVEWRGQGEGRGAETGKMGYAKSRVRLSPRYTHKERDRGNAPRAQQFASAWLVIL